jgi:iron-sulfur cluster repair protein YtfE (RIC family)
MGANLQDAPLAGCTGVLDHPTIKFARMLDYMKEEHAELRDQLVAIADRAAEIREGAVPDDGLRWMMARLAERVRSLHEQVARHARDEDDILVPTVRLYADDDMAALEKKAAVMERASGMFRAFLDLTDDCLKAPCRKKAGEAAQSLLEACTCLKRLFAEEADTLYPLAEEIIEDIDYLSS